MTAHASQDASLTPCDRATLHAMLDWAAAHHSASCWAGRGTIAQRAAYSFGSVKRSIMLLESYGYFTSEGKGGPQSHTAMRTFTPRACGSLFADETIRNTKIDPRRDTGACEGGHPRQRLKPRPRRFLLSRARSGRSMGAAISATACGSAAGAQPRRARGTSGSLAIPC